MRYLASGSIWQVTATLPYRRPLGGRILALRQSLPAGTLAVRDGRPLGYRRHPWWPWPRRPSASWARR